MIQKPGISCFDAFFEVSDRVKKQTFSRQQPWVRFDGAAGAFRKYTFMGTTPAAITNSTSVVSTAQQNPQTMQEEVALIKKESNNAVAGGAKPVPQLPAPPQGPDPRQKANEEVSAFLRGWVANQESNSALAWTSDCATLPKYTYWEGPGGAPYSFLFNDRQKLIKRYPIRSYEVIGDATGEFFNNYQEAAVVISYHYQYDGAKKTSGNSINTLRLKKFGTRWKITASSETVRRNELKPAPKKPKMSILTNLGLAGFQNQWLQHNTSNHANDWVADFAVLVDYCFKKTGLASHADLRKDRQELITKYPNRKYEIENFTILANDGKKASAKMIYRYDYGGTVKGRSSLDLTLVLINGSIVISKYDKKIHK